MGKWGLHRLACVIAAGAAVGCGSVANDPDGGGAIDAPQNIDDGGAVDAAGPDAASGCSTAFDCDDDNRCTSDSCLLGGECDHANLHGIPVPGAIQTPGDCQELGCIDGEETSLADNTDVPVDGLECTRDLCTDGVPSNPAEPIDTECSAGTCDGEGNCTGCTLPSDCGVDSYCRTYTCTDGVCGVNDTTAGTPLPAGDQTDGDCRRLECNGSGGVVEVEFNTDVPPDDGNQCTRQDCSGGSPVFPPEPLGTDCSDGGIKCNGEGECVACVSDSDCASTETCDIGGSWTCDCTADTCLSLGATCGTFTDGCGGLITCDTGDRDGDETDVDCGGDETTCPTRCDEGQGCAVDEDCIEGVCSAGGFCDSTGGLLDCDGDGAGECATPFCCGLLCATEHQNGLGDTWFDCDPLFTYNEEQAFEACAAWTGDFAACIAEYGLCGTISTPDGGFAKATGLMDGGTVSGGDAVCAVDTDTATCACWQFSGDATGYVNEASGSCGCPNLFDPIWD